MWFMYYAILLLGYATTLVGNAVIIGCCAAMVLCCAQLLCVLLPLLPSTQMSKALARTSSIIAVTSSLGHCSDKHVARLNKHLMARLSCFILFLSARTSIVMLE